MRSRFPLEPGGQSANSADTVASPSALQSNQGSASNIERSYRGLLPAYTTSFTSSATSIPQNLPSVPVTSHERATLNLLSYLVEHIEYSTNAWALSCPFIPAREIIEKYRLRIHSMVDAELEVLTEILVRKLEEFLIRFDLSNQLSFQAAAIQNKKTDSEFTLFPKMPVELQEMVWKKALPGPRVIEIFFPPGRMVAQISKATHLALFNVRATCKQAYSIVSKKYRAIAARIIGLRDLRKESVILIDDNIDIWYFHSFVFERCFRDANEELGDGSLASWAELAKITKLALPITRTSMRPTPGDYPLVTALLPELKSLKKLIWVGGKDDYRYRGSPLHFFETSFSNTEGYPWTDTLWKAEWQRVVATTPTFRSNLDPRYATNERLRELIKNVDVEFVEIVREHLPRLLSKEMNKVIIEKGFMTDSMNRWPHFQA